MSNAERRTVMYEGPAPFVSLLAQMLREEGVDVSYEPPIEKRGAGEVVETVVVSLFCAGTYDAIKYGLQRFAASRLGRNARTDIEGDDDE